MLSFVDDTSRRNSVPAPGAPAPAATATSAAATQPDADDAWAASIKRLSGLLDDKKIVSFAFF